MPNKCCKHHDAPPGQYIEPMPDHRPHWPLTSATPPDIRAPRAPRRAWAWPQQCNICSGWQGERVCPACVQRFAGPRPRCMRCAIDAPGLSTLLDLCGACLTAPPAFDLAVAVPVVALILPPLCGWVWLCQRRQAPGPLFHTRERCGRRGHEFPMLKFRTMVVGADRSGFQTADFDARITRIGRVLRKTSLDELPQLWSILKGDMSFVGPRPERPEFVGNLTQQIPFYGQRHVVRPGLTGWAQVNGRDELPIPQKVALDAEYLQSLGFWFDIKILWLTFLKVLLRDGVCH